MLTVDRRYFRYFDWLSFGIVLVLASIGLLFVFSATYKDYQPYSTFFQKQAFGVCTGILIYATFCLIDYRVLMHIGYILYTIVIGFLIITLIKGSIGMGAQRWVDLLFFKFQPSEVAKLFFPAFITYYLFTNNDSPFYKTKDFLPLFALLIFSTLLIRKQPDLGTALLILFSGCIIFWIAGLSKKFFLGLAFIGVAGAPLAWRALKPYQKKRIAVFLGEGDNQKDRYQIEQSKIAIGSGGITGKGFLHGTQNKLMFLPESRTDFIFSVVSEETGFLGALALMLLYLILFGHILIKISCMTNFYAQLLALGLIVHIMLSCIINICMVTGLLPVVGIPLPYVSYGISNLWINFASMGWINGIIMRNSYLGE
jgi:rod shape determining protein RodA